MMDTIADKMIWLRTELEPLFLLAWKYTDTIEQAQELAEEILCKIIEAEIKVHEYGVKTGNEGAKYSSGRDVMFSFDKGIRAAGEARAKYHADVIKTLKDKITLIKLI